MKKVTKLNAGETLPFVGSALEQVAAEVGDTAAVLGFVGAPFTLATYIVEVMKGWTSQSSVKKIKSDAPILSACLHF